MASVVFREYNLESMIVKGLRESPEEMSNRGLYIDERILGVFQQVSLAGAGIADIVVVRVNLTATITVIELKRGVVGIGAMEQALRYRRALQWMCKKCGWGEGYGLSTDVIVMGEGWNFENHPYSASELVTQGAVRCIYYEFDPFCGLRFTERQRDQFVYDARFEQQKPEDYNEDIRQVIMEGLEEISEWDEDMVLDKYPRRLPLYKDGFYRE